MLEKLPKHSQQLHLHSRTVALQQELLLLCLENTNGIQLFSFWQWIHPNEETQILQLYMVILLKMEGHKLRNN
jgi:hypothetical protein